MEKMKGFDLICASCGEKAELRGGYKSDGIIPNSKISVDFEFDEDV
ncbi:hypothetical protein [Paenibacillus sp. Soil787]|nr:hypothetical protein [Paenibacillus sp. Soil787]